MTARLTLTPARNAIRQPTDCRRAHSAFIPIERGKQNITIKSPVKVAKALKGKVMDWAVDAGM